jgi:hypothetical protein
MTTKVRAAAIAAHPIAIPAMAPGDRPFEEEIVLEAVELGVVELEVVKLKVVELDALGLEVVKLKVVELDVSRLEVVKLEDAEMELEVLAC